jgi:hypothetical protein
MRTGNPHNSARLPLSLPYVGGGAKVLTVWSSVSGPFHGFPDDWAQETDLPCGLVKVHEWWLDQNLRLDKALQPGKEVNQK